MKQPCLHEHRASTGRPARPGCIMPAALLLAVLLLLAADGAILSGSSAWNQCTSSSDCSKCAVGQPCCKLDGSCLPMGATSCVGTMCNTACTDENVCTRKQISPSDCGAGDTKCTGCAQGKWCCKDDGACFDPGGCAGSCSVSGCTESNVCNVPKTGPITPGNCTATDAKCMACPIGKWCCKDDGACFDSGGCAGSCAPQCTNTNVCNVAPITPTLNPPVCTTADTKCTQCPYGAYCCKADGSCFNPHTLQTCGGGCMGSNCTATSVCDKRMILPRTCTASYGATEKKCVDTCQPGQLCCTKDGTCIDNGNKTCAGTACAGDNCNTNTFNLCIKSQPFPPAGPPACTATNGNKACMDCPANMYCCLQDGACFDPSTTCPNTSCANDGCNSTQVCKKVPVVCPTTYNKDGQDVPWVHTLTFANNSSETIWIAGIPGCWNNGANCHPLPTPPSVEIPQGGTTTVQVPSCWSGGFVFRTNCTFDVPGTGAQKHCKEAPCCKTGDCVDQNNLSAFICSSGGEAPASRIEMTFDGGLDSTGAKIQNLTDTYDISFVNGWTKMVTMVPTGTNWSPIGPNPEKLAYWCMLSGCDKSPVCPEPLTFTDTIGTIKHTYCWAPVGFSGTVHANDASFTVTYKGKTETYTNDNAGKSRLGCVCDTTQPISCADPPKSETINPKCYDPTGDKSYYGCSPYSEPGKSHLYSQCCPWTTTEPGATCGWDTSLPNQAKRVWPDWAQDYVRNIKAVCQKAYTWQYDDTSSTYNCQSTDQQTPINYSVTINDGGGSTPSQ